MSTDTYTEDNDPLNEETDGWQIKTALYVDKVRSYVKMVQSKMDQLAQLGAINSQEDWDAVDALAMEMPKLLTNGIRLYQACSARSDELAIQRDKLRHNLKDILKRKYHIQLNNKAEIEDAMLHNRIYEQAVVEFNIQNNNVELLDRITDQLKYMNNIISTKYEGAKLRANLGY